MSVVGTVLTTVSLLAVAMNFFETAKPKFEALDGQVTLRFSYVDPFFWLIAGVQQIVGVPAECEHADRLHLVFRGPLGTFPLWIFRPGHVWRNLLHRAAILHGEEWSAGVGQVHFGLTFCGVLVAYIALLVAGIGQGFLLNDPAYSFTRSCSEPSCRNATHYAGGFVHRYRHYPVPAQFRPRDIEMRMPVLE